MIAFASLILGLTLGVHPVSLTVEGAASVQVLLDGVEVARLEHKPWVARVDFGTQLLPHELVARALDSKGQELARASQMVNLPRAPAESRIVVERDVGGRVIAARLAWASLTNVQPKKVAVTFDGQVVPVSENRIVLPAYDPATVHVLTAEVEFSPALRSRSDFVIGGGSVQESTSELTGVAVELETGHRLPDGDRLANLFVSAGQPLRVAAAEEGPIELLIIRDTGSSETERKLATKGRRSRRATRGFNRDSAELLGSPLDGVAIQDDFRDQTRLSRDDRARFVWPVAQHYEGAEISSDLFTRSHDFDFGLGLYSLLTRVEYPGGTVARQRLADAVAVAAVEAVGASRRRAVLLVLGSEVSDSSVLAPANVRGYLEALRVPLFVWSLENPARLPAAAAWGPVEDVSSEDGFEKAFTHLKKTLSSQRIVWIEGRHLPQAISLSPGTREIRLAR